MLGADLSAEPVTEADLARLPAPVAAYVRQSGAVGQPRVITLRARFHGRIRGGPAKPWMTFTGEQVNRCGARPSRLFLMDAELLGLPIEVLHVYNSGDATMRVRALSLFTMVDASGPEMDRAETVTIFNDLCVLAPAALIDAPNPPAFGTVLPADAVSIQFIGTGLAGLNTSAVIARVDGTWHEVSLDETFADGVRTALTPGDAGGELVGSPSRATSRRESITTSGKAPRPRKPWGSTSC